MIWYIIRHADNEQGDYYNSIFRHQDQPISTKGKADAKNLVSHFAEKSITNIYVSEYRRIGQTIEPLAKYLGLSPIVDNRLIEIDNGVFEGLSANEVRQRFPDIWNVFKSLDRDFQFHQG